MLRATVAARRSLVRALLAGGPAPAGALAALDAALAELSPLAPRQARREQRLAEAGEAALRDELRAISPRAGGGRLEHSPGEQTPPRRPAAPVEQIELQRDRLLAAAGEPALHAELRARLPGGPQQVESGRAALAGPRYATLLADRDGTVVPYFQRYGASVQSAWGALCLTRMARRCSGRTVVLTAGPLQGPGAADLAVTPGEDVVYAASKGREWSTAGGEPVRSRLAPEQAARMDALGSALEALLERPEKRRFRLIGSGLQLKHGQVTVARQDVAGSIPAPESEALLAELRRLVDELDPGGRWFRLEDTGFDVEIHLASAGGDAFDKGDGVRLLEAELPLGLGAGPALVCGDTLSDVAMLEAVARLAPATRAAFVVRPADPRADELRRAVRQWDPEAVFVTATEALLLLLDALARQPEAPAIERRK